ncbi:hypothetical protein N9Y74_00395 [Alphaproteobacteria bacterium]|nr:hypothetical protein [Alphaproteobacteria bacterium]
MKSLTITKALEPTECADLIRLGKDFDGGYLVSRRDVDASDGLIGLGVSNDWSFERDFRAINKVGVDTYDRSVGALYFFRDILRKILRIYNLPRFISTVAVFFSYLYFFGQRDVSHHRQFIGLDSPLKSLL